MVMNKHGFLKILEAIIAIIIVLGFMIAILPKVPKDTAAVPPDLDQTTKSILKEMQENAYFRNCVLGGSHTFDFDNDTNTPPQTLGSAECVRGYIGFLSYPTSAHPWDYAVRTCGLNLTGDIYECYYAPASQGSNLDERETNFKNSLPQEKHIYIKSTTMSFPDITIEDPTNNNIRLGNYSSLTIYAWS